MVRTSRAVTGSLSTFYEDKGFQDAFLADTQYSLRAVFNYATSLDASGKVFNTTGGNIIAVSAPQMKFSEVNVGEESGLFKYDTSFACEPTGSGDNEFVLAFL